MQARAEKQSEESNRHGEGERGHQPYLSLDLERLPSKEDLDTGRSEADPESELERIDSLSQESREELDIYNGAELYRIKYLQKVSKVINNMHAAGKQESGVGLCAGMPMALGAVVSLVGSLIASDSHALGSTIAQVAILPVTLGVILGTFFYQAAKYSPKFWGEEVREAKEIYARIERAKEVHQLDQKGLDALVADVTKDYENRIIALEAQYDKNHPNFSRIRTKIENRAREIEANGKGEKKKKTE